MFLTRTDETQVTLERKGDKAENPKMLMAEDIGQKKEKKASYSKRLETSVIAERVCK